MLDGTFGTINQLQIKVNIAGDSTSIKRKKTKSGLIYKKSVKRSFLAKFSFESFPKIKKFCLDDDSNSQISLKDFECAICGKLLIATSITNCLHNFCEGCLYDWLTSNKECYVCKNDLRIWKIVRSSNTDDLINLLLDRGTELLLDYVNRLNSYNNFKLDKRGNLDLLKVGDFLDVLDTELVWCIAEVKNVIRFDIQSHITSLEIHYVGWNEKYDEILDFESPRLAKLGFYTLKGSIPFYQFDNLNNFKNYVRKENYSANLMVPIPEDNTKNKMIQNQKKAKPQKIKFKRYRNLKEQTDLNCEEFHNYENSKICD